ncbi:MAG: DJ-1/PfpI family protein, partial [Ilumatobacter sp.]
AGVVFVGAAVGPIHAVEPSRAIRVDCTPVDAPHVDVLVVPGGLGWKQVIDDPATRAWLTTAALEARGILAISTGSLLLASVGRLEGRSATGHWLAEDELAALGVNVSSMRTASDDGGRVVTASGALAAVQVVDGLADQARWAEWMPDGS